MSRLISPLRMLALIALLASVSLFAQSPNLVTGRTYVTFDPGFVSAAQSLDLSLGVVYPTQIVDGTAGFPITGGALELDNAKGQILHSGGLVIRKGTTRLRLQDFIIDTTGSSPVITGIAVLNGKVLGRLPLFNVILPPGFVPPIRPEYHVIDLKYPDLTLTETAAGALNSVFDTSAFQPDFKIGFSRIIAATQAARENSDNDRDH